MRRKKIALVIPTQEIGGMESAMAKLANEFALLDLIEVYLIKLTKGFNNFALDPKIIIIEPIFDYKKNNSTWGRLKTLQYLHDKLLRLKPDGILSFGDRYNSIAIIAALGTKVPVYVSNRMNPNLSNGFFIDALNKISYKFADGIIAQTKLAALIFKLRYANNNIKVIPNPIIEQPLYDFKKRENIILNVGRFGDQKNQHLLIDYFLELDAPNWKLVFVGDGPKLKEVKKIAENSSRKNQILFEGSIVEVKKYYEKSKIFAFTSTSEGFPNALGEAMASGLACVSFDCVSGPSDLIDSNINGYLIETLNKKDYVNTLQQLINSDYLVENVGLKAREKVKEFDSKIIALEYLNFIFR